MTSESALVKRFTTHAINSMSSTQMAAMVIDSQKGELNSEFVDKLNN